MEENYKLEKEYQITPEIFDKAYRSYQKKFVYPKSYIFMTLFLTLAGGFQDAYSYNCRDHVFANAQTGNMLLFGVNAAGGDFAEAMKYFWPVITFTVGIILADFIRSRIQDVHVHWRQIVLVGEILLLFGVFLMS